MRHLDVVENVVRRRGDRGLSMYVTNELSTAKLRTIVH